MVPQDGRAILRCRASRGPLAAGPASPFECYLLLALFVYLGTVRSWRAFRAGCVVHQWAVCRYLEVQSSGRRDEVRLHYVAAGGSAARVETFPFRLADGAWHRLALAVSGAQATLLVDCHPLYRRLIPPPDRNFTMPMLSLWLGQRNSKHSLFKVSFTYCLVKQLVLSMIGLIATIYKLQVTLTYPDPNTEY